MKNETRVAVWISSVLMLVVVGCGGSVGPAATEPTSSTELTGCFAAPGSEVRRRQVEAGLRKKVRFAGEGTASLAARMAHYQVPAFSLAVIRDGALDWTAAYGDRVIGEKTPVDCTTRFQAASLAKPVTMIAVLRMARDGKIDLDADIGRYLQRYQLPAGEQSKDHPVTFRRLLTHTAGITPGGYLGYARGETLPTDVETVTATGPANSRAVAVMVPPGTRLAYSGGAYTVAEIAIEDLTGAPFDEVLEQWVLGPVGMAHATFSTPLPAELHPEVAHAHSPAGQVVEGGWRNHPEQAAAGLWASATDLALFLIEIAKGYRGKSDFLASELIAELLAEPIEDHAFGFRLQGEGDTLTITHYGGNVGYRAGMTLHLASGDGAVFLTNSDGGGALGRELLQGLSAVYGWPHFRQVVAERGSVSSEILRSLAGAYRFAEQGWRVEVEHDAQADQIALIFPNGDRYSLVPTKERDLHFIYPDNAVTAWFDGEPGKRRIHLYGQVGLRDED